MNWFSTCMVLAPAFLPSAFAEYINIDDYVFPDSDCSGAYANGCDGKVFETIFESPGSLPKWLDCRKPYSCKGAVFKNGIAPFCGEYACSNVIVNDHVEEVQVICEGTKSCKSATFGLNSTAFCSGKHACMYMTTGGEELFCSGSKSCKGFLATGGDNPNEAVLNCAGDSACHGAVANSLFLTLACLGKSSCQKVTTRASVSTTCDGNGSCEQTVLEDDSVATCGGGQSCTGVSTKDQASLDCTGRESCKSMIMEADANVECSGLSSCDGGMLRSVAQYNATCTGLKSCKGIDSEGTRLICEELSTCEMATSWGAFVYCDGDLSCLKLKTNDDSTTECYGKGACESAKFWDSSITECSGDGVCLEATLYGKSE
eukprot:CAMPEP_0194391300 /NCGR_PEP_ID=MMETSP0174-20130528/114917_1 /TAXON_ID=216777 /ORGANISM="Proboscia alata, Strain PI-D3" /LENGTH=372 /DNA_ID=CAMNT_0039185501 /DNA_START=57 /DNA_END=1172 /DNA_ORIENTATION=-